MVTIVEHISVPTNRVNAFFFGNIMLRFFTTKKTDCPGKFANLELLNGMFKFISNTTNATCVSKTHLGDQIDKNITIAGRFNYTEEAGISRKIVSSIGTYDTSGISIVFYRKK